MIQNMTLTGVAGTAAAVCPASVRPLLRDRWIRRGTGGVGANFGAIRTFPAIDVAFPFVRALD